MAERKEIRNSTAEFLIFQIEGKEQGVEVFYKNKTVWCTQKAMGILFDCSTDNIGLHLKNIYESGELKEEATAEKISVVRREGNRDVNRVIQFYNLDAVISVGYRVNSIRATQFRQWATNILRDYSIRGYRKYPLKVLRWIILMLSDGSFMKSKGQIKWKRLITFQHKTLGRKVSFRHLIKLECYKLAKHLLGIEEYKPFKTYW